MVLDGFGRVWEGLGGFGKVWEGLGWVGRGGEGWGEVRRGGGSDPATRETPSNSAVSWIVVVVVTVAAGIRLSTQKVYKVDTLKWKIGWFSQSGC